MSTAGGTSSTREATSAGSRSGSRSRGASESGPSIESLVCFVLGGRSYALDVSLVREVVNVGTVFPVPNTPAPVAGVFLLRGATVALVDTARLLGIQASEATGMALVLVRNHQTLCGMTIDRVVGVTRFVGDHFIPADPEREPPEVVGFMPDERSGLLTVLDSSVVVSTLTRLRFR
jgi:purine-binding chemotaxis protein CheW